MLSFNCKKKIHKLNIIDKQNKNDRVSGKFNKKETIFKVSIIKIKTY